MGKYIKLFNAHSEYETFTDTIDFIKPNVSVCKQENEVHYSPFTYADVYLTFIAKANGTFNFSGNSVSYSVDNGSTWTELASDTASPTVTEGSKIMWKATLTPSFNGIGTFNSTAKFDVEGNVMSLLFGDDFKNKTDLTGKDNAFYNLFRGTKVVSAKNMSLPATTLADACYTDMFDNCQYLTTAPQLPATTLASYCYYGMFSRCTSLTTAPQLPATTLASNCYYDMFGGCTSLTTAPELPATTLADYCYGTMFQGCTSLTTAPELPATTLVTDCYNSMFQGCTSLTTAPAVLPATTLAEACYYIMFGGCTSLTTAPELPATTLKQSCYNGMFNGCTSLTAAPALPATTLTDSCYRSMFYNCRNLNYIKCLATDISASNCTYNWVYGAALNGTFVKAASMTSWTTEESGIPSDWTVQNA